MSTQLVADPVSEVARLLRESGGHALPVNIGRIAELLGARVFAAELDTPAMQGITVASLDDTAIYVSDGLQPEWKRVVVARELAKMILGRGAPGNQVPGDDRAVSEIAGELPMPREQVLAARSRWRDPRGMAELFYVPERIMRDRLEVLGLAFA